MSVASHPFVSCRSLSLRSVSHTPTLAVGLSPVSTSPSSRLSLERSSCVKRWPSLMVSHQDGNQMAHLPRLSCDFLVQLNLKNSDVYFLTCELFSEVSWSVIIQLLYSVFVNYLVKFIIEHCFVLSSFLGFLVFDTTHCYLV